MLTLGWPAGTLRLTLKADAAFQGQIELRTQAGTPLPWPAGTSAWLRLTMRGTAFEAIWPATITGALMAWSVPAEQVALVPSRAWAQLWLDYPDHEPILWVEGAVGCGPVGGLGYVAAVPVPQTGAVAVPVPGPPGPPGPGGGGCCVVQAVAAHPLGGHRLVVPRDNGTVEYADATDPAHINRPLWLTTSAWAAGAVADLVTGGEVTELSWTWTPGVPLLVGTNGMLTHTLPAGAVWVRRAALPVDPVTVEYAPTQPIALT